MLYASNQFICNSWTSFSIYAQNCALYDRDEATKKGQYVINKRLKELITQSLTV
jgi:hypothetical protein